MSDEELAPFDSIGKAAKETPPDEEKDSGKDPFTGKGGTYDKELGVVGKFLGGNAEKSGNIAFCVIVLCLVFMALIFLIAFDSENGAIPDSVWNLLSLLGAIVSACVGYIFGEKQNSN